MQIARALANSPSVLLLDEVTGDLDTVNAHIVMKLLTDLNRCVDAVLSPKQTGAIILLYGLYCCSSKITCFAACVVLARM